MRYRFIAEPDDNDTWLLTVPALPGVVTFTEDMADAATHLRDAIECYLAFLIDEGRPIPPPDGEGVEQAVDVSLPAA